MIENKNISTNIYPNPANSILQIKSDDNIDQVEIFNSIGKQVISEEANSSNLTLDVSELPTGQYIIRFKTNKSVVNLKQIIGH